MPTEKIQDSLQTSKQEKATLSSFQLIEKNLPKILPQTSPEELQTLLKIIKEKLPKGSNQKDFLINLKSVGEKDFENIKQKLLILIEQEEQKVLEQEDIARGQPVLQWFRTITQDTETTSQDTETTSQDTETTSQDTETTSQQEQANSQKTYEIKQKDWKDQIQIDSLEQKDAKEIQAIEDILEQTKKLQNLLNPNYTNHTPEQLQNQINTISPQVKSKLENANIKLEDYASFLLSREKIGNNTSEPQNEAFLKSLKNLEHSLWIPETSKGGFFRGFEPQKETFDQNPDLAKYANGSQDFSAFEKLDYFPEMMPFEEEKKLIQTFGSPALREFFQKVAPLLTKDQHLLSEIEKQALENYQNQLKQLKYQLESKAKNFMKASATNAPISAILKYLDSESLGGQTLTDLLEKPKSWSFAQIHQEGKDQVLHFQGTIDGNPLTFYYNLSDPNATLECDDCLYQDPVSKTFTLGKSSGARTKLNIQMPTTEQLASNLSKTCSPEKFQELLKNSSTPAEYQQQLSQLISWTVEKSFSDEKLIKSRLARHTEKNLTIQTLNSSLIPDEIMNQLTTGKQLNENPDTKRLFKLLDCTSESSTSSALQSFRSSLKKRDALIQTPDKIQKIQDPVLRSCLEKCADAKIKKSDFPARNEALLQFFNLFTKQEIWSEATNTDDPNYVLNLADFNRFVDQLEKPEKLITDDQQLQHFSPAFQEKYEVQKEKTDPQEKSSLASLEAEMEASFELAFG